MLSNNILRQCLAGGRRLMSGHSPTVHKVPTLNLLPVPKEPFESGYRRRQIGNNFVLVAGTLFFGLTAYYVFNSGVIFLNLTPPKKNLE